VKIGFPKLDVLMNNAGIIHRNLTAPTADLAGSMTEICSAVTFDRLSAPFSVPPR
jgi:short-subunit dehydrogenase involved in D-alanine esterification of teichoic acids